jgi:hypothetical protein
VTGKVNTYAFQTRLRIVRFEVFTAVTMKNAIFWDVVPCRSRELNRRLGGTYRLHFQGRKIRELGTSVRCELNRRFGGTYRLHLQGRKIRERRTSVKLRIILDCGFVMTD